MTIDEAIARERQLAKEQRSHVGTWDDEYSKKCKLYAEEHEQLAEWLEELKSSRQELNELRKYSYVQGHSDGYNNAIDDFVEKSQKECDIQNWSRDYGISFEKLEKIAEQLKVGKKDEQSI